VWNTDQEVVDICDLPDGICHSFCVSNDPKSTSCEFRGSFIGDMVAFHDQTLAEEKSCSNMKNIKIYRLSTPEFAGLPRKCDGTAMDQGSRDFLNPSKGRKHVSFELHSTQWCTSDNCTEILPPDLLLDSCPKKTDGNYTKLSGLSMGADKYSVRDQMTYNEPDGYNNGVAQTLMYQLFGRNISISKIGFGRAQDPVSTCIAENCTARSFGAGEWKFTSVTGLENGTPASITKIRMRINVKLENADTATDKLEALGGGQFRFNASTADGNQTSFVVSLDTDYLWAAQPRGDIFSSSGISKSTAGKASIVLPTASEITPQPMTLIVYIDLELDTTYKAACENKACTLIYDPKVTAQVPKASKASDSTGSPPASGGAASGVNSSGHVASAVALLWVALAASAL